MNIKRHLPNAITCGNLFCGCLAIVRAFQGDLEWTAYFVGIAAVLDFLDGFVARILRVTSAIGKDLDSLADMVTFGVVPGVVLFQMINLSLVQKSLNGTHQNFNDLWAGYNGAEPLSYFAFVLTIFSCLRLAKFNNDIRQTESFIGMNTPSTCIFICSLPLILVYHHDVFNFLLNPYILLSLVALFSFLLVCELPLFSLKFKSFNWKGNEFRFILLTVAILLVILFGVVGIPLVIIFYILLSIVNNIFSKTEL